MKVKVIPADAKRHHQQIDIDVIGMREREGEFTRMTTNESHDGNIKERCGFQ